MVLFNAENLYISELNVENRSELKEFVIDCDMVIHCGTPTPFQLDFKNAQKNYLIQ